MVDADPDHIDELFELDQQVCQLRQKNDSLTRDNSGLLIKLEQTARLGQQLLAENTDFRAVIKDRGLKAEFNDTMKRMEEELHKLEQENARLRQVASELAASTNSAKPKLVRGLTEALCRNEDMFSRIEELEAENRSLRHNADWASHQIEELEKKLDRGEGVAKSGYNAKTAIKSALGLFAHDRLQKRLEDEATRADELELSLRDMREEQQKADVEQAKLKQEFADIKKFAMHQRALKYGAQSQMQNYEVKADNLQLELRKMELRMKRLEDDPGADYDSRIAALKQEGPALRSLFSDLKDGADDISWLATDNSDDSDSDSDSGSDETSDGSMPGCPSLYSRYLKSSGYGIREPPSLPCRCQSEISNTSEAARPNKPPKASYTKNPLGHNKKGVPSAYDTMSRREKNVVKLTINETHKRLLQAFRLIEALQKHSLKLTEEVDYLEGVAKLSKKVQAYMSIGFLALTTLVIFLFFFFRIYRCEE